MTAYFVMWEEVKNLTSTQRKDWLRLCQPCNGTVIEFKGLRLLDHDLYEALMSYE